MQVSIETTSGLERRLTVGVPAERVDGEVDSACRKAARNVRCRVSSGQSADEGYAAALWRRCSPGSHG